MLILKIQYACGGKVSEAATSVTISVLVLKSDYCKSLLCYRKVALMYKHFCHHRLKVDMVYVLLECFVVV